MQHVLDEYEVGADPDGEEDGLDQQRPDEAKDLEHAAPGEDRPGKAQVHRSQALQQQACGHVGEAVDDHEQGGRPPARGRRADDRDQLEEVGETEDEGHRGEPVQPALDLLVALEDADADQVRGDAGEHPAPEPEERRRRQGDDQARGQQHPDHREPVGEIVLLQGEVVVVASQVARQAAGRGGDQDRRDRGDRQRVGHPAEIGGREQPGGRDGEKEAQEPSRREAHQQDHRPAHQIDVGQGVAQAASHRPAPGARASQAQVRRGGRRRGFARAQASAATRAVRPASRTAATRRRRSGTPRSRP